MERKQALEGVKSSLFKIWDFAAYEKSVLQKKSYIWLILAFAVLTRLYGLGSLGVSREELENIDRIFSVSNLSTLYKEDLSTSLYYILQFLWGKLFGFSVINMRAFSVLLSIVGLYFFFLFVREWFSKRSSYIATFLLSISSFYILISRSIGPEALYLAIILPGLYFLTLAYRRKKISYFLLSGLFFGAMFYTATITFALVAVFGISIIYFYFKNKKFLTGFVREKLAVILSAAIISAPFFVWLASYPQKFFSQFTLRPDILLDNARTLVLSILYGAPDQFMYNVGFEKVFDPYIETTFLLGLGYVVLKFKRRKFYFLLSMFVLFVLIIIMQKNFFLGEMIYLVPMIFIFSAVIQSHLLKKWFATFPFNRVARFTMALSLGFFLALSVTYNYREVFLAWAKSPNRRFSYNTDVSLADLKGSKVYVYEPGISRVKVEAILKGGGENQLVYTDVISRAMDKSGCSILTSPNKVFNVESTLKDKNFQIISGANISLLKGR